MSNLLQDFRLAFRSLLKNPGFSVLAVLTLALGLGATTAIFTVVQGVLLAPLAYDEPENLVLVMEKNEEAGYPRFSLSPLNYRDYRDMNGSLEVLAATSGASLAYTPSDGGPAQRWNGRSVTHNYFDALRLTPIHGREFSPEDDLPDAAPTVMLTYTMWQKLGAEASIVGTDLRIDGQLTRVIGVLPSGHFEGRDAFVPLRIDYEESNRGGHWLAGIGRLKDGVGLDQARADLERVAAALEAEYPDSNTGWGSKVDPMKEVMVSNVKQALWVLFGAVGVVLLIACANVANLTLTRLSQRERDVAVQTALGASWWRILRQMLVESLMVALTAGALGLALAHIGVQAILALDPDGVPRVATIGIDLTVMGFGLAATLLTALLFGVAPALQALRSNVAGRIKDGGRAIGGSRGHRLRTTLVVAEVAMALVLSVAGGLLLRSYTKLLDVEPGFNAESIWTASFNLPDSVYPEDEQAVAFHDRLLEKAAAIPGADKVATVYPMPLSGGDFLLTFIVEGRPLPGPNEAPNANIRFISGDYFDAMQIPIQDGRPLDNGDRPEREPVVVLNRAAADKLFPGEEALGRRITFDDPEDEDLTWMTIVGISGNVRHEDVGSRPEPAIYLSALQSPLGRATVVVRTQGDPETAAAALRSVVAEVDPNLPLYAEQAGDAYFGQALAQPRFNTTLLSLFAGLALFLAAIGVFSVLSFTVAQQNREIGVRMALGADQPSIVQWVMVKGLKPVIWGLAFGLGAAIYASRLLQNLVYGIPTLDVSTYSLVAGGLVLIAALACLLPAMRASRIEPVVVLRSE
ncbi:MAG: ABC transporter permease [Acidobacteriota bacterium]